MGWFKGMRTTYIVLLPVTIKERGSDEKEFEVLAIAPKGLLFEYVKLAIGDIRHVQVEPLTVVRGRQAYNRALNTYLETHPFPIPLPFIPPSKRMRNAQLTASNRLRSEVKALIRAKEGNPGGSKNA